MNKNNQNLFEQLRKWRNKAAEAVGVKPFMILQNSVLEEIAKIKPSKPEELATIKGMGKRRIEKYGQTVLEIVNGLSKEEKTFSVSEYLDYVNAILATGRAVIRGEIGRVDHRGGYTFFTLLDKDNEAVINCFVWQNKLDAFGVELAEGLEINVSGYPKIYKKRGTFSFEVEHIGLIGEGVLRQAFKKLKIKLESAGYFSIERKKSFPTYVESIGLITSVYADAKKDFLTHVGNFGFKIYFYDVRVEGLYAVDDIVSAIRWFNESKLQLDVLVLTRGGGSLESLQAFNNESVAKAIFASKIPVITGIGHENDITIADLVADLRASTPTDAGKILADSWKKAGDLLTDLQVRLPSIFVRDIETHAKRLEGAQAFLEYRFQSLLNKINLHQQRFISNWLRLSKGYSLVKAQLLTQDRLLTNEQTRWFKFLLNRLTEVNQMLSLNDPMARLKQGYSIVSSVNSSKIIKDSRQIKVGDKLHLTFHKGAADSKVESLER